MKYLEITLPTPAENLAFDEALLMRAERQGGSLDWQCLRVWESPQPFVVLGRSSPHDDEVNGPFCAERQIPIVRRVSGGATVMAGPGCLMYAVVLSYDQNPELRMLDVAHRFVMQRQNMAIRALGLDTHLAGTCDLVWQGKKFSGNSLRCLRNSFLYHGTFLYQSDLELIAQCLGSPARQPEYRRGRSHRDFLVNLPIDASALTQALKVVWQVDSCEDHWPMSETQQLVREKYALPQWTLQR